VIFAYEIGVSLKSCLYLCNRVNNVLLLSICSVVKVALNSFFISVLDQVREVVSVLANIFLILCKLLLHHAEPRVNSSCLLGHLRHYIMVGQVVQMLDQCFRISNKL